MLHLELCAKEKAGTQLLHVRAAGRVMRRTILRCAGRLATLPLARTRRPWPGQECCACIDRTGERATPPQHRLLALHSSAQHSTAQHSSAQHSTARHSTAQRTLLRMAVGSRCQVWRGPPGIAPSLVSISRLIFLDCTGGGRVGKGGS